jgi:hypothetical protein
VVVTLTTADYLAAKRHEAFVFANISSKDVPGKHDTGVAFLFKSVPDA